MAKHMTKQSAVSTPLWMGAFVFLADISLAGVAGAKLCHPIQ